MATILVMDARTLTPSVALAILALGLSAGPAMAPPQATDARPLGPPPQVHTPIRADLPPLSATDMKCLALNVYWESRGQPLAGQMAVAHVTLNRAQHPLFPNSVCGVVHQGGRQGPCQFGWYCDDRPDTPTDDLGWEQAQEAAAAALVEPDPTKGALYFHGLDERPQWVRGRYGQRIAIGDHVFFSVKDEQVAETR